MRFSFSPYIGQSVVPETGCGASLVIVHGAVQDLSPGRFRIRYAASAIRTAATAETTPIVAQRWLFHRFVIRGRRGRTW